MKQFAITQDQWVHTSGAVEIFLPSSLGQGKMRMMELCPGLQLLVSDYKLNETTCMEYVDSPGGCGFGFCLSGIISSHSAVFTQDFPICSGQSAFYHSPQTYKGKEIVETKRVRKVNIMLSPERLHESASFREFPRYLNNLLSRPCRIASTITPAMTQVLQAILECPYQGLARHFFLEGKVMELIAYKLEQLFYENGISPEWIDSGAGDDDIDRMHKAARIISCRLDNPPGLSELAASVGVCRGKLHRCFKQVYGVTPFDYTRVKRLETAKRLLRRGESVTETAFRLGYSSPSHFTKAFKQHFGCLPLQWRKHS